jgi:glutaconyl-CoA decarboxylase
MDSITAWISTYQGERAMLKKYRVTVNGQTYDVAVEELGVTAAASIPQATAPVANAVPAPAVAPTAAPVVATMTPAATSTVKAPMPGTVLAVKVSAGQSVKRGDVLLILEAMKMENEICALADATVNQVRVKAGSTVNTGDPMIDLA